MRAALRPRVPAALLAILAVALVSAGCGSKTDTGSSPEARALLERAFDQKNAVKSGDIQLDLKADVQGIGPLQGPLEVKLDGPFESRGGRSLPLLDWNISFDGASQKLSGGVIATEKNAFLRFQGRTYELGEDVFARFARRLRSKERDRPHTLGQFGMDPASWLENPKVEDGDPIGGDETRELTGSVNVRKVIKDVLHLVDSPAVREQFKREGKGVPKVPEPTDEDLKKVENAIEKMDVELSVDRNDVLRRFSTEIEFNVRDGGDGKDVKGNLSFTYVLRKVGGNPAIRAPSGARPLKDLFGGFGLGALGSYQ